MMDKGKMNGYICQGFNPLLAFPDQGKIRGGLAKLKFLVMMDPLETETARFWENFGPHNDVRPGQDPDRGVPACPRPALPRRTARSSIRRAGCNGTGRRRRRPARRKPDNWIMAGLFQRLREMYRKDGGAFPDPILNLTWGYIESGRPDPEELAKEINGRALDGPQGRFRQDDRARRASSSTASRNCATTARPRRGCWIFSGCFTEAGNQMARRDATDPREHGHRAELGLGVAGQPAHPLQSRQRRSVGQAMESGRSRSSNGTAAKWAGLDVPDYRADREAVRGVGPFIMNAEGLGRLFARDKMAEGPFPEHYEPFESPIARTCCIPRSAAIRWRACSTTIGSSSATPEFPYVGTTYRLTEHFHFWTKHALINAILQPEHFVEIGEELAKEKGIEQGGWVRVSSKRGVGRLQGLRDQADQADDRATASRRM